MDTGDAAGIADMREAIRLATQAGHGYEVANLHNNLGVNLWAYEGPQAALAELRTGIAYATARGLTELADWTTASTLSPLLDAGQLDDALTVATAIAERIHDEQSALTEVRGVQARIYTLHGHATHAADYLDWLETTTRGTGSAEILVHGLGAAAITQTALGHTTNATTLLTELAAAPDTRDNPQYAALLPALVRTAITLNQPSIAQQFTTDYKPHTPYAHHALITATAALAEARGDHERAADGYVDAAKRWEKFGVIPEHAHALHGHGRCLIAVGRLDGAGPVLRQARDLFAQLHATPAITETDTLLQRATALSS
jgi:hypothetical protein